MELELKHIAPYLPYELKMIFEGNGGRIITLTGITNQGKHGITITNGHGVMWLNSSGFKPLLRPLSDLTNKIWCNGKNFVPIQELFQMAYESVYSHRFDNKFITSVELERFLSLQAHETIGERKLEYGFSVELPNGFLFSANGSYLTIPVCTLYNKLFEWHFDVWGLIETELAIDINTIYLNELR